LAGFRGGAWGVGVMRISICACAPASK
jgi:hypothetical protein